MKDIFCDMQAKIGCLFISDLFSWKGEPMNNDTSNRSTPATASTLTVKEAAPPVMIKKIGKTTYRVKIHFSETSKETMSDKIKRLILNDSEKSS